jgi:hypothetical protein
MGIPPVRKPRPATATPSSNPHRIRRRRQSGIVQPILLAALVSLERTPHAWAQATTTWNGGSGMWSAAGNWSNGIPNSGTTNVFIDGGKSGGSVVALDNTFSIGDLSLDAGDVLNLVPVSNVFTDFALFAYGKLNINGTLDMSGGQLHGASQLVLANGAGNMLSGSGEIRFGDSQYSILSVSNSDALFGAGMLIHGQNAKLRAAPVGILNQGTVAADVAGGLFDLGARFTNAGHLQVVAGASMTGSINNAPSGIISNTGGILSLTGQWHNGGTINVANGTVNLAGTFHFSDVGLINRTNSTVAIAGTLINVGQTLSLNGTTGSWNLDSIQPTSGTSMQGTIQGGTITAGGGAHLLVNGAGGTYGTLDDVTLATSPIFDGKGAGLHVANGLVLSGAVLDLSGGRSDGYGMLDFSGPFGPSGNHSEALTGTGEIRFGSGAGTTRVQAFFNDLGTLTIGPGILMHGKNATILIDPDGGSVLNQGTLAADVPGGNITLTGRFTNAGTVQVISGALLTVEAKNFSQTVGGTLSVDGLFNTSGTAKLSLGGGVLSGTGTVSVYGGSGMLSTGGTVSPGHGVGTLTLNANVKLIDGSHLSAELGANGTSDLLQISGNLDLSSPNDYLDLTKLGTVGNGNTYLVATYGGSLLGTFDNVTPGYDVSYATPGEIIVVSSPEPGGLLLGTAGSVLLIRRLRRPRDRKTGLRQASLRKNNDL